MIDIPSHFQSSLLALVLVAQVHQTLAVVIAVVHLELAQERRLLFVFESAFVVELAGLAEVVQLVVVLQTDDVLVSFCLAFQEDQLSIVACSLRWSRHAFQHFPRDVDVVLDLVSY